MNGNMLIKLKNIKRLCLKINKLLPGEDEGIAGGFGFPSTMAQPAKRNTAMTAVIDFIFLNSENRRITS